MLVVLKTYEEAFVEIEAGQELVILKMLDEV